MRRRPPQRGGINAKIISSTKPTWIARTTWLESGLKAAVMTWKQEKAIATANTARDSGGCAPSAAAGSGRNRHRVWRPLSLPHRFNKRSLQQTHFTVVALGTGVQRHRHSLQGVFALDRLGGVVRRVQGIQVVVQRLDHLVGQFVGNATVGDEEIGDHGRRHVGGLPLKVPAGIIAG